MSNVKLALRGLRGESAADIARRGLDLAPGTTDSDAVIAMISSDSGLAADFAATQTARDEAEAAQGLTEDARDLAQQYASDAATVSGVNVPIYASVASLNAATVAAAVKTVEVQFYAPTYADTATLVGRHKRSRISKADLDDLIADGLPSQAYGRSADRFMPDGTTDATNGGYWVFNEPKIAVEMMGALPGTGADDLLPIQASIDTAFIFKANEVYLGSGHVVSDTIKMQSGVTLIGSKKNRVGTRGVVIDGSSIVSGSVIKMGLDNTDDQWFSGYSNECVGLIGLTVKGNSNVNGVDFPTTLSCKDITLTEVGATYCKNGFYFRRNWTVKARGLYTFGTAANGSSLALTYGLSTSVFESCLFFESNAGTKGLDINNASGAEAYSSTSFISCAFGADTGLYVSAPDCNGLAFYSCHWEDCITRNIHINLAGTPTTGQILFYSPSFANLEATFDEAIWIENAAEVVFIGLQMPSGRLNGQKLLTIGSVTRNVIFDHLNCKTDTDAVGDISELFNAKTVISNSYVFGYDSADQFGRINYMVGGAIEDPGFSTKVSIGTKKAWALGINLASANTFNMGLSGSTNVQTIQFNESNWTIQSNGSSYIRAMCNGVETWRAESGAFVAGVANTTNLGTAAKAWNTAYVSVGYRVANLQVVGARKTGWSVDTGTAKRTANATYTAGAAITAPTGGATVDAESRTAIDSLITRIALLETALQESSQTIKALKDDLHATAGHGLIGT